MAWIELHQSLWTHKKTFLLAAHLGIKEIYAAAHLSKLWTWALDNAPDGDLSGLPSKVVAFGSTWDGDADEFLDALVAAGWVDRDGDAIVLHDWYDYAGRLIEKKEANKQRMREKRASNVQRTTNARTGATKPNLTKPNLTKPNLTKEDNTPLESPQGGKQDAEPKIEFAENVLLTQTEHDKLTDLLGDEERDRLILEYAAWISGQTARVKKQRNAYLTILNWHRRSAAKPRAPAQQTAGMSKGARQMSKFEQMLREAEERGRSAGREAYSGPFG